MKKVFLFLIFSGSFTFAQMKIFPQPQIEFNPPEYICYRTNEPLNIDGRPDEEIWRKAEWTKYFIDIEGDLKPRPRFKTRAKMLWDDKYLYIAADLEEPNLWGTLKQRDTIIYYDNDFEIFIDPDGDTHKYYELEINALQTVWDLFLVKPYRDAEGKQAPFNSWDISGLKLGVNLKGTINNPNDEDEGWTCEIAIPWSVLRESYSNESTPKPGEQWRVNFSRVEWKIKNINGKYVKEINPSTNRIYPEDNWVWAPTGLINIHYPEMWGYVQLSNKTVGESKDKFESRPVEAAKWALRQLYYSEKSYFMNNHEYTADLTKLNLPEMKVEGFVWPPKLQATENLFEAQLIGIDGTGKVSIKQDGEINIQK